MVNTTAIPIIDSHVHLFAEEHLDSLSWMTKDNVLASNHTVNEYYNSNINSLPIKYQFNGLVFIEADVKSNTNNEEGWDLAIEETKYAILQNYNGINSGIIKAVVPWIPLLQGKEAVKKYIKKLKNAIGEDKFTLIKGFRYLIQDKPDGTMLDINLIEALNWIASIGFVFDLGIDTNRRGFLQFEEFESLLEKTTKVTYINNHLAKPKLSISPLKIDDDEFFNKWKKHIIKTANLSNKTGNKIYIKVSGIFSELDEEACHNEQRAFEYVFPWIEFIFKNWDHQYIIWGSDWPICNIRAGPMAFSKWLKIMELILKKLNFSKEEITYFFSKGTIKAYNLDLVLISS